MIFPDGIVLKVGKEIITVFIKINRVMRYDKMTDFKCRKINNDIVTIFSEKQYIAYKVINSIYIHQHMVLCKITKRNIPMALQINCSNAMIHIGTEKR